VLTLEILIVETFLATHMISLNGGEKLSIKFSPRECTGFALGGLGFYRSAEVIGDLATFIA
jgi:hypothetical protein